VTYDKVKALLNRSPSRPTLFRVSIDGFRPSTNDYLEFLCRTASIPSISQDTIGVNGQEALGVIRQQPFAIKYEKPFTISVIENTDFLVYKEIRQWFDSTCASHNTNGLLAQRMSYYSDIVRDVRLDKYENTSGGQLYATPISIVFKNAVPVNISSIDLDTATTNTFTQFSVSFNYESYSTTY
jgi:hypothetical protein